MSRKNGQREDEQKTIDLTDPVLKWGKFTWTNNRNNWMSSEGSNDKEYQFHRVVEESSSQVTISANELNERWTKSQSGPKLVISLITSENKEGDFKSVSRPVKRMISELVQFGALTDSWVLVKGGKNAEVFKVVGDAVEYYETDMKARPNTVIAVTPWLYDDTSGMQPAPYTMGENDTYILDYNPIAANVEQTGQDRKGHLNVSIKKYIFCKQDTNLHIQGPAKTNMMKCTMILKGDATCSDIIMQSVDNKIPVILVKDSVGTHDFTNILATLAEISNKERRDKKLNQLNMEEEMKKSVKNIKEKLDEVENSWQLLHVADLVPKDPLFATNLATTILQACLYYISVAKPDHVKRSLQHTIFEMCIESNEFDVAQDNALLPKKCKKKTMDKVVEYESVKFLDYFLGHAFDFDKYAMKTDVKKLPFSSQVSSQFPSFVGDIVRECIGHFYYTAQEGKNAYKNAFFIWSILKRKFELSKALFKDLEHPALAALLAVGLMRYDMQDQDKPQLVEDLEKEQRFYQDRAKKVITAWYKKSPEFTHRELRGKVREWGNTSCIFLAIKTYNNEFLALEPCLQLREQVWWSRDNGEEKEDTETAWSVCQLILSLFPPVMLNWFSFMGLVFFVLAFALLIVSKLEGDRIHFLEWIIWLFIGSFLLQEIIQLGLQYKDQHPKSLDDEYGEKEMKATNQDKTPSWREKLRAAMKQSWEDNFTKIDVISLLLFFVAWFTRLGAYLIPDNPAIMDAARVLLSVDFMIFTMRLLRFCYISSRLGIMVHTITKMIKILARFLIILSVVYIAYAVGSEAVLYPESKMSWGLVFYILRKAYWNMFGEFFLEELAADGNAQCTECTNDPEIYQMYDVLRCSSKIGKYAVPIMMGVFVLIANILMFNLLIAQFRCVLPFPFTLLTLLVFILDKGSIPDPFYFNPPPSDHSQHGIERKKRQSILNECARKALDFFDEQKEIKELPCIRALRNHHCCCCPNDPRRDPEPPGLCPKPGQESGPKNPEQVPRTPPIQERNILSQTYHFARSIGTHAPNPAIPEPVTDPAPGPVPDPTPRPVPHPAPPDNPQAGPSSQSSRCHIVVIWKGGYLRKIRPVWNSKYTSTGRGGHAIFDSVDTTVFDKRKKQKKRRGKRSGSSSDEHAGHTPCDNVDTTVFVAKKDHHLHLPREDDDRRYH